MTRSLRIATGGLLAGSLLFLAGGLVVLSTNLLSAQSPEEEEEDDDHVEDPDAPTLSIGDLKPAEPYARPDESSATAVPTARSSLSTNQDLAAAINAVETGDLDALLSLMRSGDYCGQTFREQPNECEGRTTHEGIYHQQIPVIEPILRPKEDVKEWLTKLFAKGPMRLTFASRDSRFPEGNDGKYYIVFHAENAAVQLSRDFEYDQLGIIVVPGTAEPIAAFIMIIPAANPLQWIQELGGNDGAKYHKLITPESVSALPGRFGR